MSFPSLVAASGTAHRAVCARERIDDPEFPTSYAQVDTVGGATDPNIAGWRYPRGTF
jgi:hypothetical protein